MIYLLKVCICSAVFFGLYLLFLKRLTFFKVNRFYLLFTLLLSFVIPALQFTIKQEVNQIALAEQGFILKGAPDGASGIQTFPLIETQNQLDWKSLVPFLYVAIVVALLLLMLWRVVRLLQHIGKNTESLNGLKLVAKHTGFTNCSFFNYVFIDKNSLSPEELGILLKHEEVHAKQLHSVDKLLLMLAKAVLWFNPIIYLYDKELEQVHEYEADEATSNGIGAKHYAHLLLKLAVAKSAEPLIHNFVKSPVKARIKMLFNAKSAQMKKLAYLLALPVVLTLVWGFTVDVVKVFPSMEMFSGSEVQKDTDTAKIWLNDPIKEAAMAKKLQPFLNKVIVGEIKSFGREIANKGVPFMPVLRVASEGIDYPIGNVFSENGNLDALPSSIKIGDRVKIVIGKSYIVGFDDSYVIYPKEIYTLGGQLVYKEKAWSPSKAKSSDTAKRKLPRLVSSAAATIDTRLNISYIKKGVMEIFGSVLEAEEITWDNQNGIITAEKASLKMEDSSVVASKKMVFDLNKGTYSAVNASGSFKSKPVETIDLIKRLEYHATDSIKNNKKEGLITLYGKALVKIDGYSFEGDKIEINCKKSLIKAYNAVFTVPNEGTAKAKEVLFDLNTKHGVVIGVEPKKQ